MSKSSYRQKPFCQRPPSFNFSLLILVITLGAFILLPGCNNADNSSTDMPIYGKISAEAALALLVEREADPEFVVIDVRTPGEFASEHLKNAINIDFNAPHFEETIEGLNKRSVCLVYCGSGLRSQDATELMRQLGFARVYELEGGMTALKQTGNANPLLELCGCD